MKKEIKATFIASILAVALIGGTAIAQTGNNTATPQQMMRSNMMNSQGMMGGNMMGMGGQGMHGQGMMGGGYGMMGGQGQGMMNRGHMGCMKMMGQGMGMMGGGMMGGGMMSNMTADNQQKFMDDTKETRKKMHEMRFEYMEAMRNPKTSLGDISDMEQKMLNVRKEMLKKAENYQSKQ